MKAFSFESALRFLVAAFCLVSVLSGGRPSLAQTSPNEAGDAATAAEATPDDVAEEPTDAAEPAAKPKVTSSSLPWNRSKKQKAPEPPMRPVSSAREMLALFNVDESQLNQLEDGRPLVSDEEETLYKILYRIRLFGMDKLHEWKLSDVPWSEVSTNPAKYRIETFELKGRVRGVQRIELAPETAERLEFTHYWQVDLRIAGSGNPAIVFTREIPAAWEEQTELNERASCLALLLKKGGDSDEIDSGEPADEATEDAMSEEDTAEQAAEPLPESEPSSHPLYFAAERIAWLPDQVEPEMGIGGDAVLLGDLGMDVGLLEDIRGTNRRDIMPEDRECFYQMLAAVRRADPDALYDKAAPDFQLERLLNAPETLQGRLLTFRGRATRIQKIFVNDDIKRRFGIDYYYQADVMIPLGDREVVLQPKPGETEGPIYRNEYPVHCDIIELPPGLEEGPEVNQEVQIAGFFFKLWAYRTDYVQSFGTYQRQPGPLFLATVPRVINRQRNSNPMWGWIGGGAFLFAILAMILVNWLYRRSDRKYESKRRSNYELDANSGKSLDDLASQVKDGPDFSNLD